MRSDRSHGAASVRAAGAKFCYGFPPSSFRTEFGTVIDALVDGTVDTDAFVTGQIPLEDIVDESYKALLNPDTEHVKILVEP